MAREREAGPSKAAGEASGSEEVSRDNCWLEDQYTVVKLAQREALSLSTLLVSLLQEAPQQTRGRKKGKAVFGATVDDIWCDGLLWRMLTDGLQCGALTTDSAWQG